MWISAGHAVWIASSVSPLMAKMFWRWLKRVRQRLMFPMRPSWRKEMWSRPSSLQQQSSSATSSSLAHVA